MIETVQSFCQYYVYLCSKLQINMIMTNEEFIKTHQNPWEEIAKIYDSSSKDCLFGENNYILKIDNEIIDDFNNKIVEAANKYKDNAAKRDEILKDRIIKNIPPEPWWGNPLKARLIILSLNPGYVPEVNMTLAKLMQTNEAVRRQLINYKAKTLRLEAESFLPEEKIEEGCPISCRDAVNMLGDWYWVKMLKNLRKDLIKRNNQMGEEEFYRQVALIEFCGYSSETAKHELPKSEKGSHGFLKELIRHISKKEDVRFLIMRDKPRWDNLLNYVGCSDDKRLYRKSGCRSQYVTLGNLEDGDYDKLLKFLTR